MKRIDLESRLRKGILPVAAFFVALGTANVSKAGVTDGIFKSSFEQLPVENISGMEEGFESIRTVYADICPISGKQITDVTFIYNTTGGGVLRNKGTTARVAMVPVSSKSNLESLIKTSKGSSSCIPYVVEEDIPLTYATTLEPQGMVYWKINVNYDDGSSHETPVVSTMMYANEDTAQEVLEVGLPVFPELLGLQFDVDNTCNSVVDGPYNAIGFNQSSGNVFGLLYRMEDHDRLRNHFLNCGSEFYTIENDSIEGVINQLNSNFNN